MSNSTENIIRDEFRKLLRKDHPDEYDEIPLADLGIDSLDFFEATMILEEDHGIVIPVEELHNSITLKDIYTLVG